MSTNPQAVLDALDFAPRCESPDCLERAAVAVAATCGCVNLHCDRHSAEVAALMCDPAIVMICHVHQRYGVKLAKLTSL